MNEFFMSETPRSLKIFEDFFSVNRILEFEGTFRAYMYIQ